MSSDQVAPDQRRPAPNAWVDIGLACMESDQQRYLQSASFRTLQYNHGLDKAA